MFQQLIQSSPALDSIAVVALGGMLIVLLVCRIPLILKITAIGCIAFTLFCLKAPEALSETLGTWDRTVSLTVLSCSAIAVLVSFLRFLKAGLVIGVWIVAVLVVAERAFPGVVQVNLDRLQASRQSSDLHKQIVSYLKD